MATEVDTFVASPLLSPGGSCLTYQQQRELLRLQIDRDVEMAKLECERERKQADRDVEMAKLELVHKQIERDLELAKLKCKMKRLDLIAAGKLRPDNTDEAPLPKCHISSNLRVMPPFNDNGLDSIFGLFESVDPAVYPPPVEGEGWPAGRQEPATRYETTRVCNYCLGKGHWKADCPVLKQKAKPCPSPERSAGPSSFVGVCKGSENGCLIQSHVFANSTPPLMISDTLSLSEEQSVLARNLPEVSSACVVTQAALRAAKEQDVDGEACGAPESCLLGEKRCPLVSREELVQETKTGPSLKPLFEQVNLDFDSVASGYCVSAGVLVRKWALHTGQVLGETLVQIDVPESLRALILNTAHASMGHVGRKKLYDRRSKRREF